jgi:hypothetical protein
MPLIAYDEELARISDLSGFSNEFHIAKSGKKIDEPVFSGFKYLRIIFKRIYYQVIFI